MTNSFDIEADEDGNPIPALALEDEEEGGEGEEAQEPQEQEPQELGLENAPPIIVPDAGPPKKKRGRPRKIIPMAQIPTAQVDGPRPAGQPPEINGRILITPNEDSDDPRQWPPDTLLVWPILIRWLEKRGLGPEAVGASVSRRLAGPVASDDLKFQTFSGATVRPFGSHSASEVIQRYLIDVYHSIGGNGKSVGCGPAEYTISFFWASNRGGTIKVTRIKLDSYQVLIAQRGQAAAFEASATAWQDADDASPRSPTAAAGFGPRPMPPHAWPQAPQPYPLPQTSPAGVDPALYQELGYLRRVQEESIRAAAENRAPNPVPPPLVAPALQAPSTEEQDARTTRIVQAALASAGIRPVSEEEKLASMMATITATVTKNILAALPPLPPPTPPVIVQPPAAAASVQSTVASLKTLLEEFKTLNDARETFRSALGEDRGDDREDRPATQVVVEQKDKSFFSKAVDMMKALPPGALPAVLAGVGSALEGSPAGQLFARAADAAKAAGTAVSVAESVQTTRGNGGWGSRS